MPRYFITTASRQLVVDDTEGTDVPDKGALTNLLRRALASILSEEGSATGDDEFWADVLDEGGRRVMTAKISLTIFEP